MVKTQIKRMNRSCKYFSALFIFFTAGTATGEPLAILPVGDSNTWGVGNPQGTKNAAIVVGYRKKLKELLSESGVSIDFRGSKVTGFASFNDPENEGWSGEGIGRIKTRVSQGMIETYEPDFLLLLVGSNDMWKSLADRTPISDEKARFWVSELGSLLDEFARRRPSMHVIVAKPATPLNSFRPLTIFRNGIDELVASGIKAKRNISVVDFWKVSNDGVHYTPKGHEEIAKILHDEILLVSTEVPEPSSLVLAFVCGLAMTGSTRRRYHEGLASLSELEKAQQKSRLGRSFGSLPEFNSQKHGLEKAR